MSGIDLSKTLAQRAAADLRSANELQFNQIQNTVIRRMNDEIAELNDDRDLDRELAQYSETIIGLSQQLPKLDKYLFDNQTNLARLNELITDVSELQLTIQSDSDDNTVSADEVEAYNTKRDEVLTDIRLLRELSFEGIFDSNPINPLFTLADELEALVAEEGVVDAEGSTTTTNDNRAIYDKIDEIQSQITTSALVTSNTIELVFDLGEQINAEIAVADAERVEITAVDAQVKTDAINELQARNSALLTAISLSFELAAQKSDDLSNQLGTQTPAPGSVLNLFT